MAISIRVVNKLCKSYGVIMVGFGSVLVLISFLIFPPTSSGIEGGFELSVGHFNDFHARFEEISANGGPCKNHRNCVGGFSRLYTAINEILKEKPNSIILNAADNFQGTIWYNLFKWNATQHFLNYLHVDATTLGNHEFEDGIEGLIPFMQQLNTTFVVCNIDASAEPDFQQLFQKSVIIERDGRKIGIIGVIAKNTPLLAAPIILNLKFLDEIDSVNSEAERLVQKDNVDTIIVLSHSGYELDKKLAKYAATKIGLIVGAHSHTFLYTGTDLPGPELPSGPYPTIVTSQNGTNIVIVQAASFSRYVGNITVKYNERGEPIMWEGTPIYLNSNIPQDETINKDIAQWKVAADVVANRVIGKAQVLLDVNSCSIGECTMGNLVTDVMVHSVLNKSEEEAWTFAPIALMNPSGLRTSIDVGEVTYNDLVTALPFGSIFVVGEIQGKYLRDALEFSVREIANTQTGKTVSNPLQVSGIKVTYNVTQPVGWRVDSLKIRCRLCKIPVYEEIDLKAIYRMVTVDFIANGGDGNKAIAKNFKQIYEIGRDTVVMEDYFMKYSPIVQEIQDRIDIID